MNIAILLLAAGRSQRFIHSGGEHKLTATLNQRPLLSHTFSQAIATGLDTYVICQPDAYAIHALVDPARLITFPSTGVGDSIAHAVRSTAHYDGWLIALGDMPVLMTASYRAVAEQLQHSPIVRTRVEGVFGHPVGFQQCCYESLIALQGDTGARSLFDNGSPYILELDDPGCLWDVDSVEDLRALERYFFR